MNDERRVQTIHFQNDCWQRQGQSHVQWADYLFYCCLVTFEELRHSALLFRCKKFRINASDHNGNWTLDDIEDDYDDDDNNDDDALLIMAMNVTAHVTDNFS